MADTLAAVVVAISQAHFLAAYSTVLSFSAHVKANSFLFLLLFLFWFSLLKSIELFKGTPRLLHQQQRVQFLLGQLYVQRMLVALVI